MPDLNAETANAAIKRLLLTCITPAMAAEGDELRGGREMLLGTNALEPDIDRGN